jgi:hypothetical protein
LIDTKRDTSVHEVQFFRVAVCDADHYLVVAKVRERPIVSKRTHKFETKRFHLKKPHEAEGKEQYRVELASSCAALEILDVDVHINKAWEIIEGYIYIYIYMPAGISGIKRGNI